jgi:hypothetical protein
LLDAGDVLRLVVGAMGDIDAQHLADHVAHPIFRLDVGAKVPTFHHLTTPLHLRRGDVFEGIFGLPQGGDGNFVAVGHFFNVDFDPICPPNWPRIRLPVGDADVQPAILFADAELLGSLWGHEVEDACRARGVDQGRGAAGVLDRVLALPGLRLAGW